MHPFAAPLAGDLLSGILSREGRTLYRIMRFALLFFFDL